MKKICTYTGNFFAYSVPVTRQATVYESEDDKFRGCRYEVSTHNGSPSSEWKFQPFKNLGDAMAHAMSFVCPHVNCKAKENE